MFVCDKCGSFIDLGGTEYDCPKGCYDTFPEQDRFCYFCNAITETENECCVKCGLSKTTPDKFPIGKYAKEISKYGRKKLKDALQREAELRHQAEYALIENGFRQDSLGKWEKDGHVSINHKDVLSNISEDKPNYTLKSTVQDDILEFDTTIEDDLMRNVSISVN